MTDPPPRHHRRCSQQSRTCRKEQQVLCVPGRCSGAIMVGHSLILSLLQLCHSTHFLHGIQEGPGVKNFLSARVVFVHLRASSAHKSVGSKGQCCPSFSQYQHPWDGTAWHSQEQGDPPGSFCRCAAGCCGLCSNIHEPEEHKHSAFPQRRLPRARMQRFQYSFLPSQDGS